jgi:hypothetical protein
MGCVWLQNPVAWAEEMARETCPSDSVSFYRLRIEYTTKAHWSQLQIENPDSVLTARVMQVHGGQKWHDVRIDGISIGQELTAAKEGRTIGITVDYALTPVGISHPMAIRLRNGSPSESRVRFSMVLGQTAHVMKEIVHVTGGEQAEGDESPLFVEFTETTGALSCGAMPPVIGEHLLWAFYYPWYRMKSWSSPELSDHPLKPYDSGDPDIITAHIEAARRSGIDGFISSWWGPDSDSDRHLAVLLDLAKERNFRVSLYFETLADGREALSSDAIEKWLSYAIARYRDHPAMMKIDGRPVIVIWASDKVPLATWRRIFGDLRNQGLDAVYLAMGYGGRSLELFEGVHEYSVSGSSIPELTKIAKLNSRLAKFFHLLADRASAKIAIATVQPGYDDRLIPGRKGTFRDREDGAFYRGTFEAAIESDPEWIFITSWNEWYEHTHIEESRLNGTRYLDLTGEYARRWKSRSSSSRLFPERAISVR